MIFGAIAVLAVLAVLAAVVVLFHAKSAIGRRLFASISKNSVPLFYIGMLTLFLYLFDTRVLSEFDFGTLQTGWIRFSYSFPYLSFAKLYTSDPGRITRQNWQQHYDRVPFDHILYLPGNECRTCLFAKPARSKHCSVCKCCIAVQDHHCLWVNNCVSSTNFRWFYLFLFVNIYVFLYGSVLLIQVLYSSVAPAWNSSTKWYHFVGRLVAQGPRVRMAACLLLLCLLLLPLVIMFLTFHLMYAYAGVTTNEADKWDDIRDLIPTKQLYYVPNTDILVLRRADGTFNRELTESEKHLPMQVVTSERDVPNIYDHGFVNNLREFLNL